MQQKKKRVHLKYMYTQQGRNRLSIMFQRRKVRILLLFDPLSKKRCQADIVFRLHDGINILRR